MKIETNSEGALACLVFGPLEAGEPASDVNKEDRVLNHVQKEDHVVSHAHKQINHVAKQRLGHTSCAKQINHAHKQILGDKSRAKEDRVLNHMHKEVQVLNHKSIPLLL